MKDKKGHTEEITLSMRFKGIKVLKFSQFDLEKELTSLNEPSVEFKTTIQFRVIPQEDVLACLLSVRLVLLETKEDFAELKVESFFEIKPFNEVIKKAGDKFDVPNEIAINVVSSSANTVRGILFEKLKGTLVEKEIYPLVDADLLFNNLEN